MALHAKTRSSVRSNQSGVVSLIVSMTIMILMTLIVVSFAFLVRRESRQSLDRQLSTQAFYAAESGMEDARNLLKANPSFTKSSCGDHPSASGHQLPKWDSATGAFSGYYDNQLDSTSSYTCVIIKPETPSIVYDNLPPDVHKPIRITPTAAISYITISWERPSVNHSTTPAPDFIGGAMSGNNYLPQAGASAANNFTNKHATMMKAAVTVPNAGSWATPSTGLLNATTSYYLYPNGGSAGTVDTGSGDGDFVNGNCGNGKLSAPVNSPLYCQVRIPMGVSAGGEAYLSLLPLYGASHVIITAQATIGGADVPLTGQQVLVDVTGRANDVLRRIQARIPISDSVAPTPGYALSTTEGFCKRFAVWPSGSQDGCVPTAAGSGWANPPGKIGDASFSTCPPSDPGCDSGDPTPPPGGRYIFGVELFNTSDNRGLTVTGCSWNFGDGTTTSNQACNPGNSITHTYATPSGLPPYPAACGNYELPVTLTIRYSGAPDSVYGGTAYYPDCE